MDLFLSWSGERSKMMAEALRDWIPLVLDSVKPWFSGKDIAAGERWGAEVGSRLEGTNFGILCLTRENLQAPWLLFEAGALSKAVQVGAVCPYLLDVDVTNITGPLSQFQAKKAPKISTLEMVQDINKKLSPALDSMRLRKRCEALWPDLETTLEKIPKTPVQDRTPTRPEPEILEELVGRIREMDRRFGGLERQMHRLQQNTPSYSVNREGPTSLSLIVDMDTPNYERGAEVQVAFPEGITEREELIAVVSRVMGLDPSPSLRSWYLVDPATDAILDWQDLERLRQSSSGSPLVKVAGRAS